MLVMKQLDGSFKIKNPRMQSYADEVHELLRELIPAASVIIQEKNKEADILSNAAITEQKSTNGADITWALLAHLYYSASAIAVYILFFICYY